MNYNFYEVVKDPDLLTKLFKTRQFRYAVYQWVEEFLRPLENDIVFESLCLPGNTPEFMPTTQTFLQMHELINLYKGGGAGHEVYGGHSWRDELHALALMNNIGDRNRFYHKELVAAMIGQITHDISVRVQERYADQSWALGHEKITAFIIYHLFYELFPQDILLLASYGAGIHTHQVAPEVKCQEGVSDIGWIIDRAPDTEIKKEYFIAETEIRRPWNDRLFMSNGKLVRVSAWLIRFADRLDAQASTLLGRHIAANSEGVIHNRKGKKVIDLSASGYYEMDADFLKIVLKPDLIKSQKGQPTTLLHVANFAKSALNFSVYSQHDHLIPGMQMLITQKATDTVKIIDELNRLNSIITQAQSNFDEKHAFEALWKFLDFISVSHTLTPIKPTISEAWSHLNNREKAIWEALVPFIETQYKGWMTILFKSIETSSDPLVQAYLPLVPQLKTNLRF